MAQRCCQVCATEQHEKKGNFFDTYGDSDPPQTPPFGTRRDSTPYNYPFTLVCPTTIHFPIFQPLFYPILGKT